MLKLNVSDIKQYFYCPRVVYYHYLLLADRKITRKMEYGREAHLELDRLEKRRALKRYRLSEGERLFHLHLASERLGLEGKLDLAIRASREYFPVEFKYTTGTVYLNHKYQVVAYAMLLEERFARPVRYGYIYRVPNDDIQVIEITPNTRDFVIQTMDFIREMLANEKMPPPTRARGKCLDCEFRHFCRDVL